MKGDRHTPCHSGGHHAGDYYGGRKRREGENPGPMSFPGDGGARAIHPSRRVSQASMFRPPSDSSRDPGRRPSRPRRPPLEAAPAGPVTCCIHLHPAAPTRPVRRRRRRRRHFPPRPPASAPPPPGFRPAAAHVQCAPHASPRNPRPTSPARARAGSDGAAAALARPASARLAPGCESPGPARPRSRQIFVDFDPASRLRLALSTLLRPAPPPPFLLGQ